MNLELEKRSLIFADLLGKLVKGFPNNAKTLGGSLAELMSDPNFKVLPLTMREKLFFEALEEGGIIELEKVPAGS